MGPNSCKATGGLGDHDAWGHLQPAGAERPAAWWAPGSLPPGLPDSGPCRPAACAAHARLRCGPPAARALGPRPTHLIHALVHLCRFGKVCLSAQHDLDEGRVGQHHHPAGSQREVGPCSASIASRTKGKSCAWCVTCWGARQAAQAAPGGARRSPLVQQAHAPHAAGSEALGVVREEAMGVGDADLQGPGEKRRQPCQCQSASCGRQAARPYARAGEDKFAAHQALTRRRRNLEERHNSYAKCARSSIAMSFRHARGTDRLQAS